jgi:hypothetical protein
MSETNKDIAVAFYKTLFEGRGILLVAVRSGEGPLTEHITATQVQPPERVFMPHFRPSRRWFRTAQ